MNALLVRADANPVIGTGHIMRCLALAQAWQDQGGSVTFACAEGLPESLHQRLSSESMSVRLLQVNPGSEADARAVIELARQVQTSVVVVDGYHFGADYQRWLKDAGLRLLFIDDNGHAEHYYADWVLNQNIHASEFAVSVARSVYSTSARHRLHAASARVLALARLAARNPSRCPEYSDHDGRQRS